MEAVDRTFSFFKFLLLVPIMDYFKSERGNVFMRRFGNVVAFLYYSYQAMHLYLFLFYSVPILFAKYPNYDVLTFPFSLFGVFISYKGLYNYTLVMRAKHLQPEQLVPVATKPTHVSSELKKLMEYSGTDIQSSLLPLVPFQCHKCLKPKLLRQHHCSVCNMCVQQFDHHCLWTNSCIGLHNWKHFLQLNLYGVLGCGYAVVAIGITYDHPHFDEWSFWVNLGYWIDLVILKLMLLFCSWNFYLCYLGYTHVENKYLVERQAKVRQA